ncbi:MAG: hypothetical protein V1711_00010 [bacterium]
MYEEMVGKIISVSYVFSSHRWLGLVVDQSAGRMWAADDPVIEYEDFGAAIIVRVLGFKLTEGPALGRTELSINEPNSVEVVRWAFVQTKPNTNFYEVVGPDLASIKQFTSHCRNLSVLKGGEILRPLLHDLVLLGEYLNNTEKENKFLKMLEEVLPRK